jgi:hypothetical protein
MSEPSIVRGEVLARLSHLEPLLAGRRVLVVGTPGDAGASAAFLSGRGVDATIAPSGEDGLAPSFDRILVHPEADRPLSAERIGRLGALLAPGGLLAVGVPGAEEGAGTLLREAFPVVEVVLLVAVSAWAAVPADAGPDGLTWDGTGLGSTRPTSLLFLCGERSSGSRGATVLALPPVAATGPDLVAVAEAERAGAREAELSAQVVALSWRRDALEEELAAVAAERDALRSLRTPVPGDAPSSDLPDLLSP